MNIINIDKIKELLNSNLTSYKIAKDTDLSPQLIDRYRVGGSDINNMQVRIAKILSDYAEGALNMKQQDINIIINNVMTYDQPTTEEAIHEIKEWLDTENEDIIEEALFYVRKEVELDK